MWSILTIIYFPWIHPRQSSHLMLRYYHLSYIWCRISLLLLYPVTPYPPRVPDSPNVPCMKHQPTTWPLTCHQRSISASSLVASWGTSMYMIKFPQVLIIWSIHTLHFHMYVTTWSGPHEHHFFTVWWEFWARSSGGYFFLSSCTLKRWSAAVVADVSPRGSRNSFSTLSSYVIMYIFIVPCLM